MSSYFKGAVTFLILLAGGGLLFEYSAQASDIPAQYYANPLQIRGKPTGSLRGNVVFPSEYNQHSVTFDLSGRTFVTYPDGRFLIERLLPGKYTLNIQMPGFEAVEMTVQVKDAGVVTLKPITLHMARGQVSGRLIYPDGQPAGDIRVRLTPSGTITATDTAGEFRFVGVPSGTHALHVDDPRITLLAPPQVTTRGNENRYMGSIRVQRQFGENKATAILLP